MGQIVGVMFAIDIFNIGALRIVSATLGSLVALIADRLSDFETNAQTICALKGHHDRDSPTTPAQPNESAPSGMNLRRIVLIASAALIGLIVLLFVIALVLTLVTGGDFAATIRVIRDLVIIFLALEGILIILSVAVLALQVARLVNLLQTEVKPILENTQETVKTAQGTVEFMSDNLTEPVIRASGFLAGMSVLVTNLFGIRRALRHAEERREVEA